MASLFDPIKIGNLELKNRIVAPPTVLQHVNVNGDLFPEFFEIYRERAEGGAGLIIVEATAISPEGRIMGLPMPTMFDKSQAKELGRVADIIRKAGAKSAIQLVHAGRMGTPVDGKPPPAPSEVIFYGQTPTVMTAQECKDLIEKFAERALWSKEVGYDALHLHAAHGWLIQQFMSPYTNKRTDEYGDRTKFACDLVRRTKEVCGDDFPIFFRISADEMLGEEGITLEMTKKEFIKPLEEAGVDVMDVSAGTTEPYRMDYFVQPIYSPRGVIAYLAEGVKEVASVPVVGVGRINTPGLAKRMIEEGRMDLVAMCRALIADPDLPNKILEKRGSEIRMCIACDACSPSPFPAKCAVNPDMGRVKKWEVKPVDNKKKVLIIGGGVGGMEAARIAAKRGHDVTIVEKREKLGGMALVAGSIPEVPTRELRNITGWLAAQIKKLGVNIVLNKTADIDYIKEFAPDSIILATGSRASMFEIKGADLKKVINVDNYLIDKVEVGKTVAVIGANHGAEVALSLAKLGREVTILDKSASDFVGQGTPYMSYARVVALQKLLDEAKVKIVKRVKEQEIVAEGVKWTDKDGNSGTVKAETVIMAPSRKANKDLVDAVKKIVDDVREIGDCVEPRRILNAIHEGFHAGREV